MSTKLLGESWRLVGQYALVAQDQILELRPLLTDEKKNYGGSRFATVMARPGVLKTDNHKFLIALTFLFVEYTRYLQCPEKLILVRKAIEELRPNLPVDLQVAEIFGLAKQNPYQARKTLCPYESMPSR